MAKKVKTKRGRPPENKVRKNVNIRLEEDIYNKVKANADSRGIKPSLLLKMFVEDSIRAHNVWSL